MLANKCIVAVAMLLISAGIARNVLGQESRGNSEKQISALSDFVVASVSKLPGNRLAILPFAYLDGSFSVEGRLLADELFMELAKGGKVELLEREKLAQIVEEHKLSEKGMLDPATAPELGKIAGVNAFIFGHTVDLGHKLQLTLRIVDTQSKVVAQESFLLDKRIKTPATPLWEDIEKVKQSNKEQFNISVWTDKTEYKVGDEAGHQVQGGPLLLRHHLQHGQQRADHRPFPEPVLCHQLRQEGRGL